MVRKEKKFQNPAGGNKDHLSKSFLSLTSLDRGGDKFLSIFKTMDNLFACLKKIKVKQIRSDDFREAVKNFVKEYFRVLRPELGSQNLIHDELDKTMQYLMQLTNAHTSTHIYKQVFKKIRKFLNIIEGDRERVTSDNLVVLNKDKFIKKQSISENKIIIETLDKIVPSASLSYKQALEDIEKERFSYRGTAAELREVLREVLDYLAPDKEVISVKGFKFEDGRKNPTMCQKVKFILKNRNKSATAIEVPGEAASIIEGGIGKLVRAVYNRGSLLVHDNNREKAEVVQIKKYLDAVLCELLELK